MMKQIFDEFMSSYHKERRRQSEIDMPMTYREKLPIFSAKKPDLSDSYKAYITQDCTGQLIKSWQQVPK